MPPQLRSGPLRSGLCHGWLRQGGLRRRNDSHAALERWTLGPMISVRVNGMRIDVLTRLARSSGVHAKSTIPVCKELWLPLLGLGAYLY